MTILIILGVKKVLCSFRLLLDGETAKEIPESSRLEFLEKFLGNNFVLSDSQDNTSSLLNRGGIVDLTLLRTPLAIHHMSQELGFWEVTASFVLLAYASLASSRIPLQQLLACLNFTLDSEDSLYWNKQKGNFYELW